MVRHILVKNYFRVTFAPTSSSFFLMSSASSLEAPSLTTLGAPSTTSLASFRPRPVTSRTTLITLTFSAPTSVSSTSNSVFSTEDATAPARVLAQFAKTADKLEIKAGVVEGTVYDAKGMAAIANIPSRDVLISKLLGSLQSPITNFARVMNQLAEKGGAAACEAAPTAE